MDNKRILQIGIGIVIAIFLFFLYYTIRLGNINKQITKENIHQSQVEKQVDSLRILNNYLETLNKIDGTSIKQVQKNIAKNDSIIDTLTLQQLQKLLSK